MCASPPTCCPPPPAAAGDWGTRTARVPFLQPFVYASQAPAALVEAWGALSANSTDGDLAAVSGP